MTGAGIDWVGFVPAAALTSAVPGANQVLSLRNAVRCGTTDATIALLGRFTAFAILVVLVAVGFGAVVLASPAVFTVITWAGVAYLTWLGLTTIRRALRRDTGSAALPGDDGVHGRWAMISKEFVVAITNPKALLLFAAFLPQFATVGAGGVPIAVLGFCYIGIEAISALGYTLLGGRMGRAGPGHRAQRRLDAVSGISFLALAGFLAFEHQISS